MGNSIMSNKKQIVEQRKNSKITIMKTLNDNDDDDINTHSDDIFGDVAKKLDEESVSDDDMNCSEESDHGSIQDEVFEGYDDDKKDEHQKNMAKISECISVLRDAEKLKLASFETMDALLQTDDDFNDENESDDS